MITLPKNLLLLSAVRASVIRFKYKIMLKKLISLLMTLRGKKFCKIVLLMLNRSLHENNHQEFEEITTKKFEFSMCNESKVLTGLI